MSHISNTKIAFVVLLFATVSTLHSAPQEQQQQRPQAQQGSKPNPAQRRITNKETQDIVQGFYVTQYRRNAEISTEVFAKILPFIEQFVDDRFVIAARRRRALNQLRQALNLSASEDQLKRLVRELDAADADYQMNQQKFFASVDPLLNVRQQAKIRIIQEMADNRIRQMLNAIQNPAGQGQRPVPENPPNN